jgi:multimeric flavodoxin WrbA
MIDLRIKGMATPSISKIKLAIDRICTASHHNMATTYKIAQKIVDTQKTVHPSETEILEYIKRKMQKEGIEL